MTDAQLDLEECFVQRAIVRSDASRRNPLPDTYAKVLMLFVRFGATRRHPNPLWMGSRILSVTATRSGRVLELQMKYERRDVPLVSRQLIIR